MIIPPPIELKKERNSPIEIAPEEFRQLGYSLVDQIATFLATLRQHPVTPGEMPATVRHAIESDKLLPDQGMDPEASSKRPPNSCLGIPSSTAIPASGGM